MIHLDQSGNSVWSVTGDSPILATVDNGVIGASGITYDSNGKATGQSGNPNQSWTGNSYQLGSIEQTVSVPATPATPSFWSFKSANQSSNNVSPVCSDDRDKLAAEYGKRTVLDSYFAALLIPKENWPRFAPTCFLFTNSAQSQYFTFQEINTPSPGVGPDYGYALVRDPLVVPASSGYGLDEWRQLFGAPRTINSGYRDPNHSTNNNSRHMLGDAIDLRNQTGSEDEWQRMVKAAGGVVVSRSIVRIAHTSAEADYVEPETLPPGQKACQLSCTHADWRYHVHGDYAFTLRTSPF
jgi:hypothetical protein